MVLGCAFMVFSGVIVLVDLREDRFCPLSLVVWGWLGCVGVEGWGGGGWCFPFPWESWGLSF